MENIVDRILTKTHIYVSIIDFLQRNTYQHNDVGVAFNLGMVYLSTIKVGHEICTILC